MSVLGSRATAQRALLKLAALKLGDLRDEFVFLGGCTVALFITDPASPDVRSTMDVDCIVDVISFSDYYQLEEKLQERGFRKSSQDEITCRWHYDDLILDVMPTDEKFHGCSNRWYKEAIKHAITYQLTEDIRIRIVTAPYFLGTKFEAFQSRGQGDFMDKDFEDIIVVIDGRAELIDEIKNVDSMLRNYLVNAFSKISFTADFQQRVLPWLLNYGSASDNRAQLVLKRIFQICEGE